MSECEQRCQICYKPAGPDTVNDQPICDDCLVIAIVNGLVAAE